MKRSLLPTYSTQKSQSFQAVYGITAGYLRGLSDYSQEKYCRQIRSTFLLHIRTCALRIFTSRQALDKHTSRIKQRTAVRLPDPCMDIHSTYVQIQGYFHG
jgi:hypothetical protein